MKYLKKYKLFERQNTRYYSYEIDDILTELRDIGFYIDVTLISINTINIIITKNEVSSVSGRKTFRYDEVEDVIMRLLVFIEMNKDDLKMTSSNARLHFETKSPTIPTFLPINLTNNDLSNTGALIERLHLQIYCTKA
jgi:hypothetical protein